jgi:hypothetical protein
LRFLESIFDGDLVDDIDGDEMTLDLRGLRRAELLVEVEYRHFRAGVRQQLRNSAT